MTQTDSIKAYLNEHIKEHPSLGVALKAFQKVYNGDVSYAAFRRVFLMYEEGQTKHEATVNLSTDYESQVETKISEKSDVAFTVWKTIEKSAIPTMLHKGLDVAIADFQGPIQGTLVSVHYKGEPQWKEDGYTVDERSGKRRFLVKQQVKLINY